LLVAEPGWYNHLPITIITTTARVDRFSVVTPEPSNFSFFVFQGLYVAIADTTLNFI